MILDFNALGGCASIGADLCIVGGGMAGLTVARALAGRGLDVCVLETGGLRREASADGLNLAVNVGPTALDLETTRPRVLGGSTIEWGSYGVPMWPHDFEPRPNVPAHRWPFGYDELAPYYERARVELGLVQPHFDERLWPVYGEPAPALDRDRLRVMFWQFRSPQPMPFILPLRFGTAYREELQRSPNVRVLTDATAVQLRRDGDGRPVVEVRSRRGQRGTVHPRAVLLAGGAVENARLLMVSNGPWREHDLVGRYFMERPHVTTATIEPRDLGRFLDVWATRRRRGGVVLQPGLWPAPEAQERHDILNASAAVDVIRAPDCPTLAAGALAGALRRRQRPDALASNMRSVLGEPGMLLHNGYRRLVQGKGVLPKIDRIVLYLRSEPEPNRDSRLTLAEGYDELGMARVRLDWRLTERDRRTVETVTDLVAGEMARLGLATLRREPWLEADAGWPDDLRGGPHHAGTTRMDDDPTKGVVDRHGKVHGTPDVFVTGTSTFPGGGCANPGLTVVALALRAAEHLQRVLRR